MLAISSSSSPCAACKFLRRKCTPECIFAPYFPPDNPQKFANVHKVFGASNVSKLLNELHPSQREDAVNSLAYEAEARLSDPVYGCVGIISLLQHQLKQLQIDLAAARTELSRYTAATGMTGPLPASIFQAAAMAAHQQQQYYHQNITGTGSLRIGVGFAPSSREQLYRDQQHILESQQMAAAAAALVAAREQQEMTRNYDNSEIARFRNSGNEHGISGGGSGGGGGGGGVGFNHLALSSPPSSGYMNQFPAEQRTRGGEE
ncbi:protein LATERAL ORGAN BOUNDARIES-like [Nymphaea colorata]|nr:protein LATERAL ORGAN BOUNDARIES-like [Nymphaea colorata]